MDAARNGFASILLNNGKLKICRLGIRGINSQLRRDGCKSSRLSGTRPAELPKNAHGSVLNAELNAPSLGEGVDFVVKLKDNCIRERILSHHRVV